MYSVSYPATISFPAICRANYLTFTFLHHKNEREIINSLHHNLLPTPKLVKACSHMIHSVVHSKLESVVLFREQVGEISLNSYIICYQEIVMVRE